MELYSVLTQFEEETEGEGSKKEKGCEKPGHK